MLRLLFHHLHHVVQIDYCGRRRRHPRYPEEWDVSVHITMSDYEHAGTVEVGSHNAIATRATYAAGIDDAARRALAVLCYEEGEGVARSSWRHFPH